MIVYGVDVPLTELFSRIGKTQAMRPFGEDSVADSSLYG